MLDDTLTPGEEKLLDISDSARRRVICGLSWGGMEGIDNLPEDLAKKGGSLQDLDLVCLLFDKFGSFIDGVTGEEGYRTGDGGNIYHTGDVTGAEKAPDDEQIALELFNLSSRIHQIFFIAEVQSGQNFEDISNPKVRLTNPMDDHNLVSIKIGGGAGATKSAFVFGSIRRHARGWMFRYIGDYLDGSEVTDWASALRRHLEIVNPDTGSTHEAITPEKGETVKLRYSQEARQRVMCALNWDPAPQVSRGALDKLRNRGQNTDTFDLDLACVMYDSKGEAVDGVSAKPDENVDSSGQVYHSGDDTSGEGDQLDDEAISVELKGLPSYIHHVIFLAEIQSQHTFQDIHNPTMRFADGKTNEDQLMSSLASPEGRDKTAYIFARISRKLDSWTLTFVDEYIDGHAVEDWIDYLRRYLG